MSKPNYLKKLFKKTATGAIQQWLIGTEGTTIVTTYGQVNGAMQTTTDSVKSGKNLGRKNATDRETQAAMEAQSRWLKKKKSGYVESLSAAERGEVDAVIEGGIIPMLAKSLEDCESKVVFPVAVQPKLDGHRCIAVIDDAGEVTLWTRTRKPITSVPHIQHRLKEMAHKMDLYGRILDGELYSHSLKDDFEKLTSIARKKEVSMDSIRMQYHVYDIVSPQCFEGRIRRLNDVILYGGSVVHLVDTVIAQDMGQVRKHYDQFKKNGYEGAMVRLLGMGYENKRSHQLLKVKEFMDGEFEIVGVVEGRGKLQGHGIFICDLSGEFPNDQHTGTFRVKMSGETEKLKEYWINKKRYLGKRLTVQFQGYTRDGSPRFPVGLRFREDL